MLEHFGPEVGRPGTQPPVIDRAALAARAFATTEQREWLEALLWPRVGREVARWRSVTQALTPSPRALVVETPLLFEAGLEDGYDATIAVVVAEETRTLRAGGRGHAALDERTARQLSQEEKSHRATYTVRNDGSETELEQTLSAVLDRLTQ